MAGVTAEEWGARYAAVRSQHEDYAARLHRLLLELLNDVSIDTEAVEARAKTIDSFVKKVGDKGQEYRDPLTDMPDLVGLRIVTYIADDALRARDVLEENFDIDWDRSSRRISDGDPDKFGYVSDHYEVRLRRERAALPEWTKFATFAAEIQVRTVLQHAWAAISHKLQYKAEREAPRKLRRQLSRISALLEVADKEFSELTEATAKLDADYLAALEEGKLDIEINADSIAAFLQVTQRHMHYSRVAEDLGFAKFGELHDDRAADWTLVGFQAFVDLVLLGSDLTEESKLADLDRALAEPAPHQIREGLAHVLEKSRKRGLWPAALPINTLAIAYATAMREILDPEDVRLILNLPPELSDALESLLRDDDVSGT